MLTAFTALVALMPVALSNDPLFKPLAICIVSGVFFSTILTLLIVPALYVAVSKNTDNLKANLRIKGDLLFLEKYLKNMWSVHLSSPERHRYLRLK
ncbi:hypothetical protein OE903_06020 [Bacillus sp. B6(2022)]|nr:hypothetical protein [Bacillus sp. B6(2022)]